MKILIITSALILSGCQSVDWSKVDFTPLQNYANQMNQQSRMPLQQGKTVDLKCIQDCRAMGYLYNFCESRCEY